MNAREKFQIERASDLPARELTEQQARFVQEFISGKSAGNALKSAVAAGYSQRTAGQIACALLKHPGVSAAIDEGLREAIGGALCVQAVALLRRVIGDEAAPLKLRADCAARVVEYSGIVERTKLHKGRETGLDGATGPEGKRLGEMTRGELEGLVRNGAAVLAAAAALPPASGPVIEGKTKAFVDTGKPAKAKPNGFQALA
jgi:hypothetical protein